MDYSTTRRLFDKPAPTYIGLANYLRPIGALSPAAKSAAITLIDDLLRHSHDVRLRVTGRSMSPWLEDGAIVTLRRVSAQTLTPGDIVLFRTRSGRPLLHRLIRREQSPDGTSWLLLKGDSCAAPDERVSDEQLLGRVTAVTGHAHCGETGDVSFDYRGRSEFRRVLAAISHRSPRLYRSISRRLLPSLRRFRPFCSK